ncbi:centrosomal protein of 44 kDa isoform X1 [Carcharodon carcharias]|uniref:centrosomal protein of 44 kDa isoform X1 n=1 Tax=Carcharodon carcharias TaxID=13397 RepID=UPI001B7EBD5F|nr:centrosomal protein of 44 kDa isoform X1 [Carcharodon carcharias]XP_041041357.1 centrosomal protein of 44 kDa isoform X1 [Carcharodon carcharias]
MTTGDLKGSLRKLEQSLRSLNYPEDIDYNGLAKGDPAAFLPIISYAFISYSTYVTEQLLTAGVELAGKNDSRFLDAVYKLLRNQFQYKPLLLKDQFLHYGFAERKMQLSCDIINIVTKRHKELSSLNKVKAQPYKNSSCPVKIHTRFKCESLIPDSLPSESNITIKPLVERHLSSNDVKTIHISSNPENEVVEDKPVREYSELPSSHESQALEIEMLKHQIAKCQEKLQVLDVVQSKLQALECATAGKVIIDEKDWNNLLSRVVLLETQLLLHSRKNDIASDSIGGNEEYTLCQMTSRNSSDKEMRVETPESLSHQSSGYNSLLSADESPKAANINSLCLTEVTKTEAMKHKVERISKMIEETTELLKCTESSADNNAPSPLLSQKQSTTDA